MNSPAEPVCIDTETVGLTGCPVLIQHDLDSPGDESAIQLHEVWHSSIRSTLNLVERIVYHPGGVLGFNLVFDWFQLQRLHNVLTEMVRQGADPEHPPTVFDWLKVERAAIWGDCLKPQGAIDVFLFARKGPEQSLMGRDDIRIRKVPNALAHLVAEELPNRVQIDDKYFSGYKDGRGYQWLVEPVLDEFEEPTGFSDVVLRFNARSGLKFLAKHLLGADAFEIPIPADRFPKDKRLGYDPFNRLWLPLIDWHVNHWRTNKLARKYARNDVVYTRALWEHYGKPPTGDYDSELACQVASSRWRGFDVDLGLLAQRREKVRALLEDVEYAPRPVLHEIKRLLTIEDPTGLEAAVISSTNAAVLKGLAREYAEGTPLGDYVRKITAARSAKKRLDNYDKLLRVGRLHAFTKVIATLSGRQGGDGGLSCQGFPKEDRPCFFFQSGGDFDSFEVCIAEAIYDDPQLSADIRSGHKLYHLFGSAFMDMDPEEVDEDKALYKKSKIGTLATLYGAQLAKVAETMGLTPEEGAEGDERWRARYPGVGAARKRIQDNFCSMRQDVPGGPVVWHEPQECAVSLLGYERRFTLENQITRALFDLANNPPGEWQSRAFAHTVIRKGRRQQTEYGAALTALYGCAFGIQARSMRAAANHEIQATGAQITKELQLGFWDLQPKGIHPWRLSLLNLHDEIVAAHDPQDECLILEMAEVKRRIVDCRFKQLVPSLGMTWQANLKTWGDVA